jgi:ComF family protein
MLFTSVIELIYPRLCSSCGANLQKNEHILCTYCHHHLPKTWFHRWQDNPLAKVFWGRLDLEHAVALYFYTKGGKVQHLLHQLKYKNHPEVGNFLGEIYGRDLMADKFLADVDVIIPVPLHPKKLHKRGYNQSLKFAEGISAVSSIPLNTTSLVRKYASETQTRKSRYKRWENVKEIFSLQLADELEGKHLLLVDDVITTGATIEACCNVMLQAPGIKLSVAAIATAI